MTPADPTPSRHPASGAGAGGQAWLARGLAPLLLLPRAHKQILMAGSDLLLLSLALWLAFALRMGHPAPAELTEHWWLLLLPLVSLPLLGALLVKRSWAYKPWVAWTAFGVLMVYTVIRNIPAWPFILLAPG
jgi:hypothetical protein